MNNQDDFAKNNISNPKYRKDNSMFSSSFKRRAGRRISVWVLVFALMLTFFTSTLIIPASSANMSGGIGNAAENIGSDVGEAISDVGDGIGEAISDVGDGMSEAMSDMGSENDDGDVNDTDGVIGNADSGADKAPESDGEDDKGNGGWIALAIAIVVIVAVVVLIVVLIPRRKDNE